MACKYYGKSHVFLMAAGELVDQGGNECALVFDSFSPCRMEEPDEAVCSIAIEVKAQLQAIKKPPVSRGGTEKE